MDENVDPQIFIEKAKFAEQVERYEDMAKSMKQFVELNDGLLDKDQRQLFSVAYKSTIAPLRNNLRHLRMQSSKGELTEIQQHVLDEYRLQIETALRLVCYEVLALIERILAKTVDDGDKVFYLKMRGDYYRYLAEVMKATGHDSSKEVIEEAQKAYQQAMDIACAKLEHLNPIRLGLVLNYSVFYYEIIGSVPLACKLAKESLHASVPLMDKLDGGSAAYNDATLILQLLSENLNLWESGSSADDIEVDCEQKDVTDDNDVHGNDQNDEKVAVHREETTDLDNKEN